MIKYLLILIPFLSFGQTLETAAHWESLGAAAYSANESWYLSRYTIDSNGHLLTGSGSQKTVPRIWDNEDVLMGCVYALQTTKNTVWMDRMMAHMDSLISIAEPISENSTTYYDWPIDGDNEQTLNDSRGKRSVFRFLYLVSIHPTLLSYMTQSTWDYYYAWWEKNILEKWEFRGCNNIMRILTHMSSHYAEMYYYAALMETNSTRKAEMQEVYEAYMGVGSDLITWCPAGSSYYSSGDTFPNQLRTAAWGGWVWAAAWGNTSSYNDIDHTNAEVKAYIDYYELGYQVTSTDINKLDLTFNEILDNSPDADYARVPEDIDAVYTGSNTQPKLYYGWNLLGGYSETTQDRLEDFDTSLFESMTTDFVWYYALAYNKQKLDGEIGYGIDGSEYPPSSPSEEPQTVFRNSNYKLRGSSGQGRLIIGH